MTDVRCLGRQEFPSNEQFGEWLATNNLLVAGWTSGKFGKSQLMDWQQVRKVAVNGLVATLETCNKWTCTKFGKLVLMDYSQVVSCN